MLSDATAAMLSHYKVYILTLHILGTVLGVGGATIADLLFFRFLSDYRISAKECGILSLLKGVILMALTLIIASGIALYFTDLATYSMSAQFQVKMLMVAVISLNGIALHHVVAPHLLRLDMRRYQARYRSWRRTAFALGAVSACSWYSAFFTAMLKSILPDSFSLLIAGYLVLLSVSVATSQCMERRLSKQALQ